MIIITDKEHGTGLHLNEYKGKLGIIYGWQDDETFKPFWVYRQRQYVMAPVKSAMPHRVALGTPKQAKAILQKFIEAIDDEFLNEESEE